ncbi:ABC transporter substrate-binding protein [Brooklawnia cerclae]|uniref:Peptide/nickel transport system substrate-binding protein n=1 Tax=Brooklawnia cerclae TaxID=349934 RepID=A0ABX0SKH2_9ACTN|nr:ABC transporter substrate-binding protein [Brooklawnia cerclae]NIH57833.1 peptide/nickel transport system substrate-binding protein [Brooklawnia cerclae]
MSRSRRRRLALLALSTTTAISLTALTGCASGTTDNEGQASASPTAGGNLTYAISSDAHCVDPQQVGNNDAIASARQTVASLTAQDPDTGEIVPWLAAYEQNADATEFTFTLEDGPTYADGTAIDAASVKTNFEHIQELGAAGKATLGGTYLKDVSAIETPDERTVVVKFSQSNAQFLQATSTFSLGLLSPASAEISPEERCTGDFVGSGPFSVESYTFDSEIVLKKVPGYDWGPSTNDHTGEAYLDTITVKVIPESGNRTGSLQSGQIDATAGISSTDLPLFDGNGFTNITRSNPGVVYNLYPNESSPKLSDKRVRQALSKAINRQELVDTVLGANDKPATGVLASTTPYYTDFSDLLTYDPDGAEALLDEAGWTLGADGIREKDGTKLSFVVTYWQPPKELLELVQQQWREIGVDLQLKYTSIAEATEVNDASGEHTYELFYGNLTRADPDIIRSVLAADGPGNYNQRETSEVDEWLAEAASVTDQGARQEAVDKAQELLLSDAHSIPTHELSTTISASEKVHDLKFEASSRLDFYDAWIEQ